MTHSTTGEKAIGASLQGGDPNQTRSRFPSNPPLQPAPGRAMIAGEDFVSLRRLAGRENIEIEVAARSQIRRDAPEGAAQIARCLQMIERVEVCRDQIDSRRQREAADVLLQKANVRVAAIARRLAQHRGGVVHGVDRRAPAAIQVTGKQSRPAADISCRAKSNVILLRELLEGSAETEKKRNAQTVQIRL